MYDDFSNDIVINLQLQKACIILYIPNEAIFSSDWQFTLKLNELI